MSKQTHVLSFFFIVLALALSGCSGAPAAAPTEDPAATDNEATAEAANAAATDLDTSAQVDSVTGVEASTQQNPAETEADLSASETTGTPTENESAPKPLLDAPSLTETSDRSAMETDTDTSAVESDNSVGTKADVVAGAIQAPNDDTTPDQLIAGTDGASDQPLQSSTDNAGAVEIGDPVPFTATPGLEKLQAYRMNFEAEFDGLQQGRPASGSISGLFEATQQPAAQHWLINTTGETLRQLVPVGSVELYSMENTVHIQNPQDGSWISLPKFLIDGMLPEGMSNPEDSIELPQTAVLQPGKEIVNGIVTRRYTFGPDDVVVDGADFESVEGTIWVAVDGDYVVKYEAVVTGQFDDFAVGGMQFLDEGTLNMVYELSDINGEFTIEAPVESSGFNLGDLFN